MELYLRWDKPKHDGGRPISHYIIQKKDKFGGWFDALITDDQNCVATIDELEARVPGLRLINLLIFCSRRAYSEIRGGGVNIGDG